MTYFIKQGDRYKIMEGETTVGFIENGNFFWHVDADILGIDKRKVQRRYAEMKEQERLTAEETRRLNEYAKKLK